MELILNAIDSAAQQGHCFPAIVTALTVPDIAGAVDEPGNNNSQARYIKWITDWFLPKHPDYSDHGIDGFALYALRCKLLHEGLSDPSKARAASKSAVASKKKLIAFNIGHGISMHLCTSEDELGNTWTALRAETFCSDITTTTRAWISAKQSDSTAMQTLKSLVDIRVNVPPLSMGVPLICAAIER